MLGRIALAAICGTLASGSVQLVPRDAQAGQTIQVPTAPLLPTDYKECSDLSGRYIEIEQSILAGMRQCTQSKMDVFPIGPCRQELNRRMGFTARAQSLEFETCVPFKDDLACLRLKRDDETELCRNRVAAYLAAKRLLGGDENSAEKSAAERTYSGVHDTAVEIYDSSMPKATFGQQLAKKVFKISMVQIKKRNLETLRQLENVTDSIKDFGSSTDTSDQNQASLETEESSGDVGSGAKSTSSTGKLDYRAILDIEITRSCLSRQEYNYGGGWYLNRCLDDGKLLAMVDCIFDTDTGEDPIGWHCGSNLWGDSSSPDIYILNSEDNKAVFQRFVSSGVFEWYRFILLSCHVQEAYRCARDGGACIKRSVVDNRESDCLAAVEDVEEVIEEHGDMDPADAVRQFLGVDLEFVRG
ncbi:MAG: hypothetical protein WD673_14080 [Alphaproteobacteria bacterium]